MHSLTWTLLIFGLLAVFLMINTVEAGSILSALGHGSDKTDDCAPPGAPRGRYLPKSRKEEDKIQTTF
ncbi:unnamed protein product [Adineta steineri]|uniref:Uncharacterized protein n=1 Tax=Adineta steineri TaxID=433720 RepID=A0A819JR27_9BILA|nr:unnamed protein product [Adineta steineri]